MVSKSAYARCYHWEVVPNELLHSADGVIGLLPLSSSWPQLIYSSGMYNSFTISLLQRIVIILFSWHEAGLCKLSCFLQATSFTVTQGAVRRVLMWGSRREFCNKWFAHFFWG